MLNISFGPRGDSHRHIFREELGVSVEFGMNQVHGNIPETRWTRRVEFGLGWTSKDSYVDRVLHTRFWIYSHRTKEEPSPECMAMSIYWRPYDGLRIWDYLHQGKRSVQP